MTEEHETIIDIGVIDLMIDDLRERGLDAKSLEIGNEIASLFIDAAGDHYAEGAYRGIPVSFNARDPAGIVLTPLAAEGR